jgi:hypothetical protein
MGCSDDSLLIARSDDPLSEKEVQAAVLHPGDNLGSFDQGGSKIH